MSNPQTSEQHGAQWLRNNEPNMKTMDMNWTADRYDYPQYVRDYIANNWIKVSDRNGGTYTKPQSHNDDEGKYDGDPRAGNGSKFYKESSFAQSYLKSSAAKGMDDNNKNAMNVWANKGADAAVKHMMEQAGSDYGRMRSMFG